MYLISEYYELGRFSQGPFFLFTHGDMSVPRKLAAPEEHDALHLPHRIMTPEYLRWYDYWLKGIDTGIMDEPPMKLLVRGINKFRYGKRMAAGKDKVDEILSSGRRTSLDREGER